MSFEARDLILVVLGAAFGALMAFASGLPALLVLALGIPVGAIAAAMLCLSGKPRCRREP